MTNPPTSSEPTPSPADAQPQAEQQQQQPQALEQAQRAKIDPDAGPQLSSDLSKQIDAAMADLGFDKPKQTKQQRQPRQNQPAPLPNAAAPAIKGPRLVQAGREHRKGTVVSVGPTDIFIEFGPKELGVAQRTQWPDDNDLPKVSEQIEVVIERFEPSESLFICARPGTVQKAAWELLEKGQAVEGTVTKAVKAGLELDIAGHRAFMPASQIDLNRVDNLEPYLGQKLECIVTQLDKRGGGNIVVSRRDLLNIKRAELAHQLKDKLEEGQIVEGTVRKVMDFGAFVDIGGIDGLIHISDLTHDRVGFGLKAVEKHIKPGDKVTTKVLKIDWENNRISLGLKQLQQDPFQAASSDLKEGAQVSGKVTKIMEFGAFIEIAPGVEGLVHISEIAHKRVRAVSDELKQDQVVQVQILKIDPQSRKISLSIKATTPDPMAEKLAPKTPTEAPPHLRRLREKFKNQTLKGGF